MTLYNIHTCGEGYMVGKFDEDINVLGTYLIDYEDTNEGRVLVCSCPGWPRKMRCKHCDMLELFQANDRVDTDQFYDPETKSWHRPLAPIEPDPNSLDLVDALKASGLNVVVIDENTDFSKIEPDDTLQPGRYDDGTAFHPAFGPIKRRF